jgi:GNAT superfamily N-acetyltransferase
MITIESADFKSLNQEELIRLHDLMVYAYEITEREIWGKDYTRMFFDEFVDVVKSGAVILARLDNEIVGSITTNKLDEESYGFGLLNADFSKKGLGIGRKLIAASEAFAKQQGARYMKIEILRPSNIEVPQKKMLADWYTSLGYAFDTSMSFEARKPDKAEKALKLIAPTQFDCYTKVL